MRSNQIPSPQFKRKPTDEECARSCENIASIERDPATIAYWLDMAAKYRRGAFAQ